MTLALNCRWKRWHKLGRFPHKSLFAGHCELCKPTAPHPAGPGHQRTQTQQEQSLSSPDTGGCCRAVSFHGTAALALPSVLPEGPQGLLRALPERDSKLKSFDQQESIEHEQPVDAPVPKQDQLHLKHSSKHALPSPITSPTDRRAVNFSLKERNNLFPKQEE